MQYLNVMDYLKIFLLKLIETYHKVINRNNF